MKLHNANTTLHTLALCFSELHNVLGQPGLQLIDKQVGLSFCKLQLVLSINSLPSFTVAIGSVEQEGECNGNYRIGSDRRTAKSVRTGRLNSMTGLILSSS